MSEPERSRKLLIQQIDVSFVCNILHSHLLHVLQSVNLYDAMFTALVQDRVEFIQLFIDSGVDLKRLSVSTLWNLYASVSLSNLISAPDIFI